MDAVGANRSYGPAAPGIAKQEGFGRQELTIKADFLLFQANISSNRLPGSKRGDRINLPKWRFYQYGSVIQ